jgi:hypothetical protein
MLVVLNLAELFYCLVMPISPPPLILFKLLQKENLWPDQVHDYLSARGKRRWHEAKASAAYRVEKCQL